MAVLSLSGCRHLHSWQTNGGLIGPDHVTPTAPVAEQWIDYNSPQLISQRNGFVEGDWWRQFGDPEIQKIVSAASQSYLPLRIAVLRVEEARRQRAIAVGNLYPQRQEFFAEFQRLQNSDNGDQLGIGGLGNTFDLYQFGFNASWEFDVWGRLRRQIEAEDARLEGSIEDQRDVKLTLLADALSAYIGIRTAQERLQFAERNITAQRKSLELAETRFEEGSSSKLDVSQAKSALEATRATIPEIEREIRRSNNRLCILLGLTPRDLTLQMPTGGVPQTPESVVVGVPADLLRRRPDIRQAERAVAAQSALVGVAAAELFPKFALRGTINWQSFDFANLFESASNAGAIIPGVRWNILNYGRLENNVRLQETRLERTVLEYRQAVLRAGNELENAMTRFVKSGEQVKARQEAADAAEESIKLATLQFEEGAIEFDRVNDLRKELIRQQDLLAIARGESALGLINVYRAMGGGWTVGHSGGHFQDPNCIQHFAATDPLLGGQELATETRPRVATVPFGGDQPGGGEVVQPFGNAAAVGRQVATGYPAPRADSFTDELLEGLASVATPKVTGPTVNPSVQARPGSARPGSTRSPGLFAANSNLPEVIEPRAAATAESARTGSGNVPLALAPKSSVVAGQRQAPRRGRHRPPEAVFNTPGIPAAAVKFTRPAGPGTSPQALAPPPNSPSGRAVVEPFPATPALSPPTFRRRATPVRTVVTPKSRPESTWQPELLVPNNFDRRDPFVVDP